MKNDLFCKEDNHQWENAGVGIKRTVVTFDDKLMLVKVYFAKGAIGEAHRHPHSQISYVESGCFEVNINGQKQILQQGDVFRIPTDTIHGVTCLEQGMLIDIFSPLREDFI